MSPRVLTIILNWRTPEMTLEAVEAAWAAMAGIAGEIAVVDNDSGDGSFEKISAGVAARGWDRVRVMQSGRNGGFGAGNNHAIRAGLSDGSRPDYVYILNSDAFPAVDAIATLVAYLEAHPAAGIAGSYIHGPDTDRPDGDVHTTTFRFPGVMSEFEGSVRFGPVSRLLGRWRVPVPTPATTGRVDWLAGCSMMIRQSVIDRIGVFDEVYFLYFEETDLCLRAARIGIETHFVRESRVMHISSGSTGMKDWTRVPGYWFDSRFYYFAKNHGRVVAALATIAHLKGGAFHWLRCKLTGARRDDPPEFLRTMLRHDAAALMRPLPLSRFDLREAQAA